MAARNQKFITVNGISKSLMGWSSELGYAPAYLSRYIQKYGKDKAVERIKKYLETGDASLPRKKTLITCNGISEGFAYWAKELGIKETYLRDIYKQKGAEAAQNYIEKQLAKAPEERKKKINYITVDNETKTAYQWAKELGCGPNYISQLINQKGEEGAIDFIKRRTLNDPSSFHKTYALTIDGVTKTPSEWAKYSGGSYEYILRNVKKGKNEKAIHYINYCCEHGHSPFEVKPYSITVNDETHNLSKWSKIINVPRNTLLYRINRYGEDNLIEFIKTGLANPIKIQKRNQVITVNGISKKMMQWSVDLGYSKYYLNNIKRLFGKEAVVKQIECCLKAGKPQPLVCGKNPIIKIDNDYYTIRKCSVYFGYSPDYFSTLKHQKGVDAVINKIKEHLSDEEEHTVKIINNTV